MDKRSEQPVEIPSHDEILSLIREIGEHERHFNTLTSTYKTMASTWLLGVFGGIGFVLANDIEPRLLYAAGIGLAGSIGILLLWIIDLRVYQQLLNAAFTEGLEMENRHRWLPRIRNNMVNSVKAGSVPANTSWFYVLGVCVPLLIFNFSVGTYLLIRLGTIYSLIFILVLGTLTFVLAYKIRFQSGEKSIQKVQAGLEVDVIKHSNKLNKSDKWLLFLVGGFLYLALYVIILLSIDQ